MTEVKNCRIQPKKNIYKPLFHQILESSKQREHAIPRVLRKYYKLKTYSKPLHLILTSNFPYILNNDQSKYSKRCWNCTNEKNSQKFACEESSKEGLICSVREEPNSVQPCQFRFLTNHCQARTANPRKQPEKLGWESGVFSGALRNAFRDPRNSPEKSPEKSSGPRSFRVFWETHAWYLIWKAPDRCLLKVGHSDCCWRSFVSFRCKSFRNTFTPGHLQSNQAKRTPQDCINELIIWNLNPLVVSRMQ